jgi:hypothetical protein
MIKNFKLHAHKSQVENTTIVITLFYTLIYLNFLISLPIFLVFFKSINPRIHSVSQQIYIDHLLYAKHQASP